MIVQLAAYKEPKLAAVMKGKPVVSSSLSYYNGCCRSTYAGTLVWIK